LEKFSDEGSSPPPPLSSDIKGYRIIEKSTEMILVFNSSKELHKADIKIKEGNQCFYIKTTDFPLLPWECYLIQDMPTRSNLYNEIIQYLNL